RSKRDWSSDVCSSDLPLADRAGAQHVVAEEEELVLEPLAQLGQLMIEVAELRDVSLVVQEVDLQADQRAVLAVQRAPRVVHAVRSEERRVGKEGRSRW